MTTSREPSSGSSSGSASGSGATAVGAGAGAGVGGWARVAAGVRASANNRVSKVGTRGAILFKIGAYRPVPTASQHRQPPAPLAERDLGEVGVALGLLDRAVGDQPDLGDPLGRRPADVLQIVGKDGALLAEPFAQIGGPGVQDDVGLAVL